MLDSQPAILYFVGRCFQNYFSVSVAVGFAHAQNHKIIRINHKYDVWNYDWCDFFGMVNSKRYLSESPNAFQIEAHSWITEHAHPQLSHWDAWDMLTMQNSICWLSSWDANCEDLLLFWKISVIKPTIFRNFMKVLESWDVFLR